MTRRSYMVRDHSLRHSHLLWRFQGYVEGTTNPLSLSVIHEFVQVKPFAICFTAYPFFFVPVPYDGRDGQSHQGHRPMNVFWGGSSPVNSTQELLSFSVTTLLHPLLPRTRSPFLSLRVLPYTTRTPFLPSVPHTVATSRSPVSLSTQTVRTSGNIRSYYFYLK